jgi:FAD:protein FMN transferase
MRLRKATVSRVSVLAATCLCLLASCAPPEPDVSAEEVLGTNCAISLYDRHDDALFSRLFSRLREIEAHMSANRDDSELAAVNRAAGVSAVSVSEDTFWVTRTALAYAAKTGGAFDPTIGPLVKLWGIGTDEPRLPSRPDISAALALIDYREVTLDETRRSIRLGRAGMRLDLGAIAKGYAADEMVRMLREAGQKRAIVDLGGNIYALGEKSRGQPWRVGVQDPRQERHVYSGVARVRSTSLVTSGGYERFAVINGKRYHHIFDTKTGYPVDSGLLGVTIICPSSIDADALSTSVFALGAERGLALAASIDPAIGVILFDSTDEISMNEAARRAFTPVPR